MARAPGGGSKRGGDTPARPATSPVRKPRTAATAKAAVPSSTSASGADGDRLPAAAALSIDDIRRLRERIESFATSPATVSAATGNPVSDSVVALVAEKLRAARAEDGRTMKDLQERLVAADKDAAVDKAQVVELNARLDESGRALADGTARIAALEAALAAHRAEAAETLDDTTAGLRDALDTADTLIGELAKVQAHAAALAKELEAVKAQLTGAQREVGELRAAQKAQVDGSRVVGAEGVAALLDDFVGSFRTRFGGLRVASGEVQLKAAFAAVGDRTQFVLPAAGAKSAELPVLHEIRLKLDPQG